ncbi:hypothetical protein [Nitratireductor sp. GCM10026969]|uniref:hypothetical protein n=1 Tax=Nitratireductor sp. GCM10026969 TaxID=3252645 RepID=UPI00360F214A
MPVVSDAIERFLDTSGPCLSTDITAHLHGTLGLSPAAARQRVRRMPETVKKLAYLPFPRNARFCYLAKDYGSRRFWAALIAAFEKTGAIYGASLGAVLARDGIVPEAHFNIVSGAPVQQKKHVSSQRVLERLLEANLLERRDVDGIGPAIVRPRTRGHDAWPTVQARARLAAEAVLLSALASWARNNGLVSYDRVKLRSAAGGPDVGTMVWDLTAPCYLDGLVTAVARKERGRPAYLVADVLLARVEVDGVRAFVRKCRTVGQLRNVKCLKMFVAESMSGTARDLLKREGIIAATTGSLFGRDFAQALGELTRFFAGFMSGSSIDVARLDALLSAFGDIKGAALQIRGTLFEFLADRLARFEFRTDRVVLNRIYSDPAVIGAKAEADLTVERGDVELVFIECKSSAPWGTVPDDQFRNWLHKQVPVLFGATHARPEWANREIVFEFWATAPLSAECSALLEAAQAEAGGRRYSLKVRTSPDLLAICDAMGDTNVSRAFERHFTQRGRREEGLFA